ncbi:hypothetical protein M4914_01950 [Streptomyces somaliensis DSM 40738]|uniref:Glutathionylspermidine synthase n=1 Tax=Streptomyces somaliensis (strain ATCC 33201 / DSM 40738 / JCM 12659 / KCTC 9044 / NCTC 11332 / NRRL B-12077 / IP 733) TaxID=1134445 RepID=A0AA44DCK5_STRE0|nr:hypothetical protein [Streptomyces somaliensis]MCQ0021849.1 hypothetical protein [Streptomyces somaliensis DSM 40738]NKY13994.1 hypothetical protein [Streptomyces somaliensis DSM 40738]
MTTTHPPVPPRSRLGHAYGEELAGRAPAGHPTAAARESAALTLAYRDRFLNGPAFLGEGERRALVRDLHTLYGLLCSLPERVFGGSVSALASAVGMDPLQSALVTRSARSGVLLPLGRADLYHDGTGFRLLEFNVTSALGGFENADINRAMLAYPPLREFVRRHRLHYRDTLDGMARTVYAECAAVLPADRPPVVAVVDTAGNFSAVGPRLRVLAGKLADHGFEGIACHLGEFTYPDGRPTVSGRAVDVVLRYFLAEDLTDPATAALLEPLLTAVEEGRVGLCSRLDAELYGNKGTLAMLSDDRHRDLFDAAELACLDRLLPWTRYVRPRATDPGGTEVDLLAHALAHREELVLKPTLLHGGNGVTAGWEVDGAEWERRIASAMDGPFVLQRRVRPVAEPFPDGAGGVRELYPNWGVYLSAHGAGDDGYAGGFVRASADPDAGVVAMGSGALVGCVFHGGDR